MRGLTSDVRLVPPTRRRGAAGRDDVRAKRLAKTHATSGARSPGPGRCCARSSPARGETGPGRHDRGADAAGRGRGRRCGRRRWRQDSTRAECAHGTLAFGREVDGAGSGAGAAAFGHWRRLAPPAAQAPLASAGSGDACPRATAGQSARHTTSRTTPSMAATSGPRFSARQVRSPPDAAGPFATGPAPHTAPPSCCKSTVRTLPHRSRQEPDKWSALPRPDGSSRWPPRAPSPSSARQRAVGCSPVVVRQEPARDPLRRQEAARTDRCNVGSRCRMVTRSGPRKSGHRGRGHACRGAATGHVTGDSSASGRRSLILVGQGSAWAGRAGERGSQLTIVARARACSAPRD
jgi:hypothetical protein